MPEIEREPAVEKVTPKEARAAAAEVSRDIEKAWWRLCLRPTSIRRSLLTEGGGEVGEQRRMS